MTAPKAKPKAKKLTRFGIPIGGVCSHRCEFCAICNGQPLKTRAEGRLIEAALKELGDGRAGWDTSLSFERVARAVQRERARERSKR